MGQWCFRLLGSAIFCISVCKLVFLPVGFATILVNIWIKKEMTANVFLFTFVSVRERISYVFVNPIFETIDKQ